MSLVLNENGRNCLWERANIRCGKENKSQKIVTITFAYCAFYLFYVGYCNTV
jgi:hypothetical protein